MKALLSQKYTFFFSLLFYIKNNVGLHKVE